jgi:hypothetical protein
VDSNEFPSFAVSCPGQGGKRVLKEASTFPRTFVRLERL